MWRAENVPPSGALYLFKKKKKILLLRERKQDEIKYSIKDKSRTEVWGIIQW